VKKVINLKALMILCIAFICLQGCSKNDNSENKEKGGKDKKIHIVTTFYPMYEFTRNIAGNMADVELLIPSNVEPHDWEPSPKDMLKIQNANVLVYNSKFLETWVPNIQKSLGNKGPQYVEASKGIHLMKGVAEEDSTAKNKQTQMDPHVWLSPALAQKEVTNITQTLVKVDPKNKNYYENNSKTYLQELEKLDKAYRTALQNVKKREIITQHAAFGYLARTYHLTQVPIAGLSPDQEPSPAKLGELKKFAKSHNLKVIYYEEVASPKVAKTLANEIGAKIEVLNTLEGLSKKDQEKGLDYITEMEENLKSLEKTLNE